MRGVPMWIAGCVLACAPFHCAAAVADIEQLTWLTGCWRQSDAEPGTGEQWSTLAGGTMLGTSRTVKGGRTVSYEFMQLRQIDGGDLAFIALPSGQDRTEFQLERISTTEAHFVNPDNHFPQRIRYFRKGDDQLLARIEGARSGAVKAIDFPMQRTRCDDAGTHAE